MHSSSSPLSRRPIEFSFRTTFPPPPHLSIRHTAAAAAAAADDVDNDVDKTSIPVM